MNKKNIDCLFIGHNEMNFADYEKNIRKMGLKSGAYRDLQLNFIQYNLKRYSFPDIFNLFNGGDLDERDSIKPLHIGETFNAAIAYLGTYLSRRDLTFDYVNSFQYEQAKLAEKLSSQNILTIAIITTLYVSVFPIHEIIEFIRKHNRTVRIIIGGPFVSTRVRIQEPQVLEYLFKSLNADFYINSSQGEAALVKIIHSLKDGSHSDRINNIYYKSGDTYAATPVLPENNRLSRNMVDWGLFKDHAGEFVNIRTSISCPFSCAFCGFPQHAGEFQTAEVEAIERELSLLNEIKTVRSVQFIDDTFNIPVKRFKKILRMMIGSGYKFRWHSHFRCQYADRETLELMKESGCEGVFLGIESGSDKMLKIMNKTATIADYQKGIDLLKEYGIITYGSFITGFPGENETTVRETTEFIKGSGIDFFRVQLWYCEPITPIWQEKEKYKIEGANFEWSHATMDAKKAADIIDGIFLSIDRPIWIPQYNFEFDGLFHLLHRGISLEKIKEVLRNFNEGIRARLTNSSKGETDLKIIKEIKKACSPNGGFESVNDDRINIIDKYDAGFDF
jgi:radical SAM PhpK family P-methyltransferase